MVKTIIRLGVWVNDYTIYTFFETAPFLSRMITNRSHKEEKIEDLLN